MCKEIDQLTVFKEELNRLKKESPRDGQAKYEINKVKKKIGFFIKKEVIVEEEGEVIEIGEYISLKKFSDILQNFLSYIYKSVSYIEEWFERNLSVYGNILFSLEGDILVISYKLEDEERKLYINFEKSPKVIKDEYKIYSDSGIRLKIFELIDIIILYRNVIKYFKNGINITPTTCIKYEALEDGFLNCKTSSLNICFGDEIQLCVSYDIVKEFCMYNRVKSNYSRIDSNILFYTSNLEVRNYMLDKKYQILSEIFIKKDSINDLLVALKDFN